MKMSKILLFFLMAIVTMFASILFATEKEHAEISSPDDVQATPLVVSSLTSSDSFKTAQVVANYKFATSSDSLIDNREEISKGQNGQTSTVQTNIGLMRNITTALDHYCIEQSHEGIIQLAPQSLLLIKRIRETKFSTLMG